MDMTIEKLRGLGHELVPFEITQVEYQELVDVYTGFASFSSVPNWVS